MTRAPLNATRYAVLGASLIAMSYGLARFAFGLYVPDMRADLGLSPEVIGRVGALPYVSFCLASLCAAGIVDRLGARGAALTACAFGVGGLLIMSRSQDAWTLAAGVFACGFCTGLMMPALSGGMHAAIRPSVHGRVGAIMNAGTSLGVIVAVPTAMFMATQWRESYLGFALAAVVGAVLAWFWLPRSAGMAEPRARRSRKPSMRNALWRLSFFGCGMGVVSSAYWVFAPDLIGSIGDLPDAARSWLWLALGFGGLAAGAASDVGDRLGIARVQGVALAGLGLSLLLLAQAPASLGAALSSALLFGLFYMMLTGIHLVTGVRLLAEHPSLGPVVPFLAIAVGQSVGSPLAGFLVSSVGYVNAFGTFAGMGVALGLAYRWFPSTHPAEAEYPDQRQE